MKLFIFIKAKVKTFILILFVAQLSCASVAPRPEVKPSVLTSKEMIRACAAEQIDMCGDLICEGDLDFDQVIAGTAWAITNCFEDTETIGKEYFKPERQKEIFKAYNVEEFFK